MYRDEQLGIEAEVASLRAEVAGLFDGLSRAQRFLFEPDLLRRLTLASGPLFAREDAAVEREGLVELLAAARAALAAARVLPTFELRFDGPAVPFAYPEPYQLAALAVFERDVTAIDPDAKCERWADRGYAALVRHEKLLFLHRMKVGLAIQEDGPSETLWTHWLRTGVPQSLPSFAIRRESTFDRIKARVGLAREVRIGNAAFDARFWVEGPADFLEALFATGLDDALLGFAPLQSLVHEDGALEASWEEPGASVHAYPPLAQIARALIPSES